MPQVQLWIQYVNQIISSREIPERVWGSSDTIFLGESK